MPTPAAAAVSLEPTKPEPSGAGDWLWIPLRGAWRNVAGKPEEEVRQRFIRHLVVELVARFADLDRWGHEAVLRRATGGEDAPSLWPAARLGDVIADLENGWSPQCLDRPATAGEWGVLKLGAVSFGTFDDTENKALPVGISPKINMEVKSGDLLISRGNVARLVGAVVVVEQTRSRLMMPDLIFRARLLPASRAETRFLAEVLRLPSLRLQIESQLTGTSPTMKKITKPALLALTFPLPPLDVQRAAVTDLAVARARAAGLRADATARRATARAAFEAAIWA